MVRWHAVIDRQHSGVYEASHQNGLVQPCSTGIQYVAASVEIEKKSVLIAFRHNVWQDFKNVDPCDLFRLNCHTHLQD
ncbi:hypothetical protein BA763_03380 [Burkholderia cenocepacia]|nr:hypothetical protein BA763_03380 [Burkholderia cenocepacia]